MHAVTLQPITRADAPALRQLFELYAHDFSEIVPLPLHESGRFDVPIAERWWDDPTHFPFLVREGERLCGFALVRRGSRLVDGASDVMDVAEFFVVRGVRRHGVGAAAAHALFEAFPGPWEIRVRQSNAAALAFWARVAHRWAGHPVATEPFSVEGVAWHVLRLAPRHRLADA